VNQEVAPNRKPDTMSRGSAPDPGVFRFDAGMKQEVDKLACPPLPASGVVLGSLASVALSPIRRRGSVSKIGAFSADGG
jgi:hypothetical protein